MTDLTRCKEFLRSFNGAYDDCVKQIEKLENIRTMADDIICHIGAYGEISIHHPKVDELLDALYGTDPKEDEEK